jgi:predicted  nucleic acid-binding Zn-ribbon protein
MATQSEASLQQVRTLREALETAERALATPPHVDGDVHDLVGRLNNAAGAIVRRIREEARTAIDAAQNELDELRSDHQAVTAARDQAEAHVRTLEGELSEERSRTESFERDLDTARDALVRLKAALHDAEESRQQEAQTRAAAETALIEARAQIDASVIEVARLTGQLETEIAEHLHDADDLASAKKANAQLEADRAEAEAFATREAQARVEVESELRSVRDQLEASLSEAVTLREQSESALNDISSLQIQLESASNEVARLGGQLEAESNENISLKGDLAAAREVREHLESSLSAAQALADREADARLSIEQELHEVRAGLDGSLSEAASLASQLESTVAEKGRLQRDLTEAQAELETVQAQREAVAAQFKAATARIRTLERDYSKHDELLSDLESRLTSASDSESTLRERVEMAERDRDDAHEEAVLLRDERDRLVSLMRASVDGIDSLVDASTVGDLLTALSRQLSAQFPRVAVFRVRGNHLEGEHQTGFEQTNDVTKLVIPLGVDSVLTRVANSRAIETLIDPDPADGATPFGGSPSFAVALPLVLQGETLAVAYADDAGARSSNQAAISVESGTAYATLVVRQAVFLLTRLTHELKTLTELREYAAMLLQEAEQMYQADAEAGRTADELRSRLSVNIDCARQLYAQRAALEGSAAATLLDEQIAATIDAQPSAPFARELAAVVGHLDLRREAEAS